MKHMSFVAMTLILLGIASCGHQADTSALQSTSETVSPVFADYDDCRAMSIEAIALCRGEDCRAVLQRTQFRCQSSDCRAMIYKSPSQCTTRDCRAYVLGVWGQCESMNCRAVMTMNPGYCR